MVDTWSILSFVSPRVTVSKVPTALRRAARGQRVIVQRRGKDVAAIVPLADLEMLERLEDGADLAAIREALAEGGEPIPWEKVKADLGL